MFDISLSPVPRPGNLSSSPVRQWFATSLRRDFLNLTCDRSVHTPFGMRFVKRVPSPSSTVPTWGLANTPVATRDPETLPPGGHTSVPRPSRVPPDAGPRTHFQCRRLLRSRGRPMVSGDPVVTSSLVVHSRRRSVGVQCAGRGPSGYSPPAQGGDVFRTIPDGVQSPSSGGCSTPDEVRRHEKKKADIGRGQIPDFQLSVQFFCCRWLCKVQ